MNSDFFKNENEDLFVFCQNLRKFYSSKQRKELILLYYQINSNYLKIGNEALFVFYQKLRKKYAVQNEYIKENRENYMYG